MGVPYAEVIGDPIAHSKSPLIHKFWLEKLALDYDYRKTGVTPNELPAYLEAARLDPYWCGANVTIPLKRKIVPLLDELAPPASSVRAVNTIVRKDAKKPVLVGHNTDAGGFLAPLRNWPGLRRTYRQARLIGTGGGAAAVAWALRREGFTLIAYSRSIERAEAFLRQFGEDPDLVQPLKVLSEDSRTDWGDRSDVGDILVNATPLGMNSFPPLAVCLAGLPADILVYDLVYDPLETPLLKAARERGLRTISGLDMLIAQAALAFELFFVHSPPREHDDELRDLLTR